MGILARIASAACFATLASAPVAAEVLTFEDRVAYQRRIEEVYWRHRLWPSDNPGPKPQLSAVLSNGELRLRVEDTLRKSNALEAVWGHTVTSAELQAELDRMIRDTRDPAMLVELFHALGDDPYVIAETLARASLVDRLTRNWYAQDTRFHAETKRRAEAGRAACRSAADARSAGGNYRETTYARASSEATLSDGRTQRLGADEWEVHRAGLERRFSGRAMAGQLGELEETFDGFRFDAILEHGDDTTKVATVTWSKTPFEDWWSQRRTRHDVQFEETSGPYTLAAPSGASCTDDTWQSVYTGTPEARAYHTAVWTGSEMIVWGGYGPYRSGGRYTPATDTWVATSLIGAPSERYAHTAVWTGTEMIVFGGTIDSSVGLATGGRYNPSTDTWSAMAEGNPRFLHTAVWTGSEMIIWGGNGGGQTGWRYAPSSDSWSGVTFNNSPSARIDHTAVWTGSEMIIWGGFSGGAAVGDGARYDPSTNSWQSLTGINAPSARRWHTAVWTGSEMIVWGGGSIATGLNTGARYSPSSGSWTPMSIAVGVPAGRVEHEAVWTGSRMLVFGGYSGSTVLGTGGEYNPSNDSWTAIPTGGGTNSPAARYGATAVWTGQEMVVWGGFDFPANQRLKTGGRYNPSTTAWLSTSTMSAPSERLGHVAVWTGSEMIVWGGAGNDRIGGRYDPTTDSWTQTPAFASAPGPDQSAAVWTGTEMIVWGGLPDAFGGAARYNPTSNSVTYSSITNAPVPRQYHTAVWTGTQMIVWGGIDGGFNHLNSGGRYTPSTNTWASTNLSGAPTARVAHAAVWTGSQMIVWGGGQFGGAAVNTGGRYDPVANTWSATSIAPGVPSARWYISTVWTGSEMIVWGGGPATDSTGGRYTPSSNTWTATSTGAHVPSPRLGAATIWTDAQMVVWGGQDSLSTPLDTGARYDVATNTWLPTYPGPDLPSARAWPSAVWTGAEMIVWGGFPLNQEGGRYCVPSCTTTTTYYRDLDGDGYGRFDQTALGCATPPPGYSEFSTDCNDADSSTYPGAPEMCDGIDRNCDTVVDVAVPQEAFFTSAGKAGTTIQLAWGAAPGATGYDVARGSVNGFPVGSGVEACIGDGVGATSLDDAGTPVPGSGYWYLLRGVNSCGGGPWGSSASPGVCM